MKNVISVKRECDFCVFVFVWYMNKQKENDFLMFCHPKGKKRDLCCCSLFDITSKKTQVFIGHKGIKQQ